MDRTERLGGWIVVGVGVAFETVLLVFAVILPIWTYVRGPEAAREPMLLLPVVGAAVSVPGLVHTVRAYRQGRATVRWLSVAACAVGASGMFWAAWLVTHSSYPGTMTPEALAEMNAVDRRLAAASIGLGGGFVLAALLLMTPPVGRFLAYRAQYSIPVTSSSGSNPSGADPNRMS